MAPPVDDKTGFEKTIDGALTDSAWDEYDCDLMKIVRQFNQYLAQTPGFKPLDWILVKAMIWTETSGPSKKAWKTKPMQIGNPGDPGLLALFSRSGGGDLIIPPVFKPELTAASATTKPLMNIKAGIAYLLMRSATFDYKTFLQGAISNYKVLPGDSFAKIARRQHSTTETLQRLNPSVNILHPKEIIKFQEAVTKMVITNWNPITTATIAGRYNVGDDDYAKKLEYCLAVMGRIKRTIKCPP
ncbi:MAG TPA: LysM peptidoglycan-binding domain-containing protein [Thermoanaerobaculia bacterium]|nr:LysM peptidoglycan-binding domain-containing protein [Thermoanaerobaculia bacterium]